MIELHFPPNKVWELDTLPTESIFFFPDVANQTPGPKMCPSSMIDDHRYLSLVLQSSTVHPYLLSLVFTMSDVLLLSAWGCRLGGTPSPTFLSRFATLNSGALDFPESWHGIEKRASSQDTQLRTIQ